MSRKTAFLVSCLVNSLPQKKSRELTRVISRWFLTKRAILFSFLFFSSGNRLNKRFACLFSKLQPYWCHFVAMTTPMLLQPQHNKFSSLSNTIVMAIFPNLCLWRRSLCSNLGGIDPEKLYRATLTWRVLFRH